MRAGNKATIVVGGQYGSEAKAKAAVRVAQEAVKAKEFPIGVRCGGPNAGHTVYFGDRRYVLRHVPACVAVPEAALIISAGSMIDPVILEKEINEIEAMGVHVRNRLFVDDQAVLVNSAMIEEEKARGFGVAFGSTQTGTGVTAANRCLRIAEQVSTSEFMRSLTILDTSDIIHRGLSRTHIIIEGTQGFGLSLFHGRHYPFCTSKDTTASAFASEVGIAPKDVTDVVMVIRTYPIRVGGNSGPMEKEISWEDIRRRSGYPHDLVEMTSVTKKVRRVGEFDWHLFDAAFQANKPTQIAIHGADYLSYSDLGLRNNPERTNLLSDLTNGFVHSVENRTRSLTGIQSEVTMVFTGPHQEDMIYAPPSVG